MNLEADTSDNSYMHVYSPSPSNSRKNIHFKVYSLKHVFCPKSLEPLTPPKGRTTQPSPSDSEKPVPSTSSSFSQRGTRSGVALRTPPQTVSRRLETTSNMQVLSLNPDLPVGRHDSPSQKRVSVPRANCRPAPGACSPPPNGLSRARKRPNRPAPPSVAPLPSPLNPRRLFSPAHPQVQRPCTGAPRTQPPAHQVSRSSPRAPRRADQTRLPVPRPNTSHGASGLHCPTEGLLTGPLAFQSREEETVIGFC